MQVHNYRKQNARKTHEYGVWINCRKTQETLKSCVYETERKREERDCIETFKENFPRALTFFSFYPTRAQNKEKFQRN